VRSVQAELFTFQNRRIPLTLAANTSSPAFGTCTSTPCGMPSGPLCSSPRFLQTESQACARWAGPCPPDQVRWQDQVASGAVIGPRLVAPVPSRSGLLQGLHRRSRAAYFDIAVEAKKENFPFLGHVPLEVGVDEASEPGQKGVEQPTLPEGTSGIQ